MRLTKKLATLATLADSSTAGGAVLEPGDVRVGTRPVRLLREEQRDVDVDSFRNQLPDRGHPARKCPAP